MKIKGASVDARYIETVVVPRGDTDYIFKARPLTAEDDTFFEELCPKPVPPKFTIPGGKTEEDSTNVQFVKARKAWSDLRSEYLFFRSLDASPDLEWDTVSENEPASWGKIEDELLAAGFLSPEIILIFNAVIAANGLDTSKIEKATKSFLATQEQEQD
ncbi:hypothetical protein KAU11_08090 [Candidatus Babeliales bacterium]|nr:hypothetical protein [Candidatus Babeliales bacterium]